MPSARYSRLNPIFASICLSLGFVSTAMAQEAQRDEPQPPKIIRKSGGVFQASATNRVEPVYPPLAKAARVSGAVVVEVTLDEEGNVISARALSGHPLLKDAAVAAARDWRFKPTTLTGVPVRVIGTITFNFYLGDETSDGSKQIEELKEQVRANPNSAELYYKLGQAHSLNRQNREALDAFNRALQLKPDYGEAFCGLGYLYYRLVQLDKAIEALNRAVTFKKGDADVHLVLSAAYMKADRGDEAMEAAREVLKLSPSLDQADASYAVIGLVLISQGRWDEAVDALKQGAGLRPNQNHFHLYLGKTYASSGDRESAMNEYKLLKEKNPAMASELLDFMNKHK
jgi:TonB family protein